MAGLTFPLCILPAVLWLINFTNLVESCFIYLFVLAVLSFLPYLNENVSLKSDIDQCHKQSKLRGVGWGSVGKDRRWCSSWAFPWCCREGWCELALCHRTSSAWRGIRAELSEEKLSVTLHLEDEFHRVSLEPNGQNTGVDSHTLLLLWIYWLFFGRLRTSHCSFFAWMFHPLNITSVCYKKVISI